LGKPIKELFESFDDKTFGSGIAGSGAPRGVTKQTGSPQGSASQYY